MIEKRCQVILWCGGGGRGGSGSGSGSGSESGSGRMRGSGGGGVGESGTGMGMGYGLIYTLIVCALYRMRSCCRLCRNCCMRIAYSHSPNHASATFAAYTTNCTHLVIARKRLFWIFV